VDANNKIAKVNPRSAEVRAGTVGSRVRELRLAAGLTQTALAGGRVSKEYISQIERGSTVPSVDARAWIASALGTDVSFLEFGVRADDLDRSGRAIDEAEALSDEHEYARALATLDAVAMVATAVGGDHELASTWAAARGWAFVQLGDLEAASTVLDSWGSRGEVAPEIVFIRGVVAYKRSQVEEAKALFDQAFNATTVSDAPSDRLRSDICGWRSRCHRRARDWDAAREDVGLAIEFAESGGDSRRIAYAHFQASLIHWRMGNWVVARRDAERAHDLFTELGDRANVGRMLNNLGGLANLLGDSEKAIKLLGESFRIAVDTDSSADAGHALTSLAEVRFERDELEAAERDALEALKLFDGRIDYMHEIGTAQLTVARSLIEQGRIDEAETQIQAAERSFAQIHSAGHEAAALLARGDLSAKRGLTREAAGHFREAAETLMPDMLLAFPD